MFPTILHMIAIWTFSIWDKLDGTTLKDRSSLKVYIFSNLSYDHSKSNLEWHYWIKLSIFFEYEKSLFVFILVSLLLNSAVFRTL